MLVDIHTFSIDSKDTVGGMLPNLHTMLIVYSDISIHLLVCVNFQIYLKQTCTVCPRSRDPFYIVTHDKNWSRLLGNIVCKECFSFNFFNLFSFFFYPCSKHKFLHTNSLIIQIRIILNCIVLNEWSLY